MAASMVLCEVLHPAPSHRPDSRNYRTLPLDSSQFLYINPLVTFRKQISPLNIRPKTLKFPKARPVPVIAATQSNFSRALQTVWKVGRDGIDAATNLVPGLVPRPIARISVTVVTLAVALFALKSLLSTVFFVLAICFCRLDEVKITTGLTVVKITTDRKGLTGCVRQGFLIPTGTNKV